MENKNIRKLFDVSFKPFSELSNVKIIDSSKDLSDNFINLDELTEVIRMRGDLLPEHINAEKNTIVLMDCVDPNSAYLHEWALNHIETLKEAEENFSLDNFNIIYIKSDEKFKELVKHLHKIHDIPIEHHTDKKYEIFIMLYVNEGGAPEFFWKSDDFDIITQKVVESGIDLVSQWENEKTLNF